MNLPSRTGMEVLMTQLRYKDERRFEQSIAKHSKTAHTITADWYRGY
jgi:hypothetical protein